MAASTPSTDGAVVARRWWPRRVRLDDVARGVGYEFATPTHVWAASHVDDVIGVIAAGEEAASGGQWVVGFVTYEAARAFDSAYPIASNASLPLAWFCSFASRTEVPLVDAPRGGPFVDGVVRTHGSRWYREGVQEVRELIETGGVYQVNLTDRVRARLVADPFDLYRSMVSTQGGSFNAFLDLGDTVIASASPELFLEIAGSTVTARPMKGTRRRHGRADADLLLADELRASEKDRAENVMIVDLLRNDLSRLSSPGGVTVPELFRVERYETVWQLTSTVQALLRPEVGLVDVFRATFPCGSITGAPKVAAMHAIARLEPSPRGLYCGAIGVIAPGSDDGERPSSIWNVAIRTAVIDAADGRVEFASGGGITHDSVPADEDDELESKVAVLRSARPAFALFETLRFDAAGAHELGRHLRRLKASAEYFGFICDLPAIGADVDALGVPDGLRRLRIVLDRRGRHRLELVALNESAPLVRLAVSTARVRSDDPFMCHKTTRRAAYERARSAHPLADDVLLVNERAEVVETTIANLLYRLGVEWFTPALASGGLPGIGREVLVSSGVVGERILPLAELAHCDELAVVNSLRGRRAAVILES